ncbi:methionyl-tRNA formyltransferase [Candidatus Phycosocius spiralis]|uniref:Methionyl-tRNA formyltransferase n=1 Tax=Candidatus Phycosocius spiralis TaxID=2815099 RepID=A0ABQ4PU93_9PROT|nr:methionyl-tRNA formyltransferase [Candidatus Phycosocius spiralis]GIU66288.1 methionyl-tRNA formyltransferase [Candidatus Phycosocius spiralis]
MGSPDFAVPTLVALKEAGHQIVCVYSQPAKPAGRGKALRATPVHSWAQAEGIEVRTPASLKSVEAQEAFASLKADAAIVVAYGLILPKAILEAPRLGCFNLHGSLLPRWRGAAPMQRAIEAGDAETGVQVMAMEVGLDTGGIYATARTPIAPDETTGSLHDRLALLGARLMVETLPQIAHGGLKCVPQAEVGITYAAKIDRAETRIDWTKPSEILDRAIRAFSPYPGAWCVLPDGARAKILLSRVEDGHGSAGTTLDDRLLIACGQGALRVLVVQREGKGVVPADVFLHGHWIPKDSRFG